MEDMVWIPAGFFFVYITITSSEMILCFSRRVASVCLSKTMHRRKDKNRIYHTIPGAEFLPFSRPPICTILAACIQFHLNFSPLFIALQFVNPSYYYFECCFIFARKILKILSFLPLQCSMLTKVTAIHNHQCSHTNLHCRGG